MSDKNQETIADIVKEMRGNAEHNHELVEVSRYLNEIADRIEEAYSRFYDKYKEHTDELNRQILILKHEKEMSTTYFCGYDPEEALVAQCSTCRFFQRKHSHCTLNDSLTNARYKCTGWTFKTNKECADEYKSKLNREVEKLRKYNTLLRASLKPILECKVMSAMTAEIGEMVGREEARKEKVTDCNRFGNVAKMLDALEQAKRVLHCAIVADILKGEDARKAFNAVTAALSAPPRNCDVLSDKQEALSAIHEDRCYVNNPIDERRLTVEWLYAEAQGE